MAEKASVKALATPPSGAVATVPSLPPSLPELEQLVATRRAAYREKLQHPGPSAQQALNQRDREGGSTLGSLVLIAEANLELEAVKLAYEEALEQLRSARDVEAERRSIEAVQRNDAVQVAIKRATIVMAIATAVLAAEPSWRFLRWLFSLL